MERDRRATAFSRMRKKLRASAEWAAASEKERDKILERADARLVYERWVEYYLSILGIGGIRELTVADKMTAVRRRKWMQKVHEYCLQRAARRAEGFDSEVDGGEDEDDDDEEEEEEEDEWGRSGGMVWVEWGME
jgi:hypothetical protein